MKIQCIMCFEQAAYVSHNSELCLCEECYRSFEDEFDATVGRETGESFNEYYEFEYVG